MILGNYEIARKKLKRFEEESAIVVKQPMMKPEIEVKVKIQNSKFYFIIK